MQMTQKTLNLTSNYKQATIYIFWYSEETDHISYIMSVEMFQKGDYNIKVYGYTTTCHRIFIIRFKAHQTFCKQLQFRWQHISVS